MADNKTGLGSDNMSEEDKERIHREGGKASAKSSRGAAGKTEAAKRGGEHSHGGSSSSSED